MGSTQQDSLYERLLRWREIYPDEYVSQITQVVEQCADVLTLDLVREMNKWDVWPSPVTAWFLQRGDQVSRVLWQKHMQSNMIIYNYPFTAQDLRTWILMRDPLTATAVHQNENLTESAIRYLMDNFVGQFTLTVLLKYEHILQPSTADIHRAYVARNYTQPIADPVGFIERFCGSSAWSPRTLVKADSPKISMEYIMANAHAINWDLYSVVSRGDCTLADFDKLCDRAESSEHAQDRRGLASFCIGTIDELCQYKDEIDYDTDDGDDFADDDEDPPCGALSHEQHDFIEAYWHVWEEHPSYIRHLLHTCHRSITARDYQRLQQINPDHAELCRQWISPGRERLLAGICGPHEMIYLEWWNKCAADVFAMVVFMCDELLSLQAGCVFFEVGGKAS